MKRTLALLIAFVAILGAACGGGGDDDSESGEEGEAGDVVEIFAVGALERPLQVLAEAYEEESSGAPIEFTFGGGSELLDQINEGAEPDIFIGTSRNVDTLEEEGIALGEPVPLGYDIMQLVTPLGNPVGVSGLDAFGDNPAVNSGLCRPEVGCGEFALSVLNQADVTPAPDSIEESAGSLLTKVADSQLDAGLLWRTQAVSRADAVTVVPFPDDVNRRIDYDMATVAVNTAADDFLGWIESDTAQEILRQRGLQPLADDAG